MMPWGGRDRGLSWPRWGRIRGGGGWRGCRWRRGGRGRGGRRRHRRGHAPCRRRRSRSRRGRRSRLWWGEAEEEDAVEGFTSGEGGFEGVGAGGVGGKGQIGR
ncbi:hypothetical protein AAC387_Pa08g0567 [Persea americana]